MNARQVALDVVSRARTRKQFVDEVLDSRASSELAPRDHGLVTGLAFGVTRHRRTLHALIEKYAGRSIERIHPRIAIVLELALFQMLFMQRIPDYAACNDAVNLAKGVSARSPAFVNAVLRSFLRDIDKRNLRIREDDDFSLETGKGKGVRFKSPWLKAKDPASRLGLRFSYPNFLVERWIQTFELEGAVKICRAGNRPLPLTARVNLSRVTREAALDHLQHDGVRARKSRLKCSIVIEEGRDFRSLKSFLDGDYTIQDETAMRVVTMNEPEKATRILDLCAAPGGKATHLAEVAPRSLIIAADATWDRARMIADSARRTHASNLHVVSGDGRRLSFRGTFDYILLDAPCTNSGVLARRPDARWRITSAEIERLSRLQQELLARAGALLSPGGVLIYSTCSIEPEENEQRIQQFLQARPELKFVDSRTFLPSETAGGGFFARMECPKS